MTMDTCQKEQTRLKESILISQTKKRCLIYPDQKWKIRWDFMNLMLVLFIGVSTPYRIAFEDQDSLEWLLAESFIDVFFFFDIILTFFTAYYDRRDELIQRHKDIALTYLRSWFFLDLFMIVPVSLIFKTAEFNKLIRLARLSRIYRLLKILRLMKFIKERNKFKQQLFHLNHNSAAQRLIAIIVVFILACHTASCMWFFAAKMENFGEKTWIHRFNFEDADHSEIYMAGVYFSIATFTTVGYGDISARTTYEMMISCILMVFGVISYSLLIGSLSSIIYSMDTTEKALREKLNTLDLIRKEFGVKFELYWKLRQSLQFDFMQDRGDKHKLLRELPSNLRVELSNVMFQNTMKGISFFKKKSPHFIASIGPRLRYIRIQEGEYIFREGNPLDAVYFIKEGKAAFVDQKEECDLIFATIPNGRLFGEIQFTHSTPDHQAKRLYTVKALTPLILLVLEKQDIYSLDHEFTEEILNLFEKAPFKHEKLKKLKLEANQWHQDYPSAGQSSSTPFNDFFNDVSKDSFEEEVSHLPSMKLSEITKINSSKIVYPQVQRSGRLKITAYESFMSNPGKSSQQENSRIEAPQRRKQDFALNLHHMESDFLHVDMQSESTLRCKTPDRGNSRKSLFSMKTPTRHDDKEMQSFSDATEEKDLFTSMNLQEERSYVRQKRRSKDVYEIEINNNDRRPEEEEKDDEDPQSEDRLNTFKEMKYVQSPLGTQGSLTGTSRDESDKITIIKIQEPGQKKAKSSIFKYSSFSGMKQ